MTNDPSTPSPTSPSESGAPTGSVVVAPNSALVRRFLIRAIGVILVLGGLATAVLYSQEGWGSTTIPALGIAAGFGLVMGTVGFVTAIRGVLNAGTQVTPVVGSLMSGMLASVACLAASFFVGRALLGPVGDDQDIWGRRVLFSALGYYVALIVVKVMTLSQELSRISAARAQATATHSG